MKNIKIIGNIGRKWDYINRIIASFAELYNYETIVPEKTEYIRDIMDMNEIYNQNKQKKYYFNLTESGKNQFGMVYVGEKNEMVEAELISLGIRILEALRFKKLMVYLPSENKSLMNYLDCFDIDYEIDQKKFKDDKKDSFQIYSLKEEVENIPLFKSDNNHNLAYALISSSNVLLETSECLELDFVKEFILDTLILYHNDTELERALYLMQELRLNGFSCEIGTEENQFKSHYTVFLKSDNQELILKDNKTSLVETMEEENIIDHLDLNF